MKYETLAALMTVVVVGGAPLSSASAQWTSSRPDGHAPIGVMGDHRHEKGEIMFSYRFMYMNMEGSQDGTDDLTNPEIVSADGYDFTVTPTRMPMMMHMAGFMYAPSDAITLVAMVPIVSLEMDHITRMGGTAENPAFTTSSSGIGDVGIAALIGFANWGNQTVHLNAGVRIPTGSIEEMDVLPTSGGNAVQLPYPMQIGSGTFDLEPGLTYLGQSGDWSWGGQGRGTIRLGDNDHDYHLGNKFMGTFWGARNLTHNLSASVRAEWNIIGDISGADPAASVNPAVVPTARTDLRRGNRLDAAAGINTEIRNGPLSGLRFAVEGLLPVYQDLDGPQLETDWTLVLGSQWAFF